MTSGVDAVVARISEIRSQLVPRPLTEGTPAFAGVLERALQAEGGTAAAPHSGFAMTTLGEMLGSGGGLAPAASLGLFSGSSAAGFGELISGVAFDPDPPRVVSDLPDLSSDPAEDTGLDPADQVSAEADVEDPPDVGLDDRPAPDGIRWVEALPQHGRGFARSIGRAARENGLDPRLLAAVVWVESDFVPDAVSWAGAIGLTQLMPATAALLEVDPTDPMENLEGGARFLSYLIDRFGEIDHALAAYNAGPVRVQEQGGPPSYTLPYIDAVLGRYQQLGGKQ